MYPYHNMIKKRIQCGELLGYYMTDNYPKIGKAMVLLFKTDPIRRPIRPHRIPEYMHLLGQRGELNKRIGQTEGNIPIYKGCEYAERVQGDSIILRKDAGGSGKSETADHRCSV